MKVVERGELTLVLLVDRSSSELFAVCPIQDGAVDRCVDSSRYFVLRIENSNGRHKFIGVAFNERNDSFDFNTSLEDAKRERAAAKEPIQNLLPNLSGKDYSIKEGEKIRVKIKNIGGYGGKFSNTTLCCVAWFVTVFFFVFWLSFGMQNNSLVSYLFNTLFLRWNLVLIWNETGDGSSSNDRKNTSKSSTTKSSGGFLKPSSKDTPKRGGSWLHNLKPVVK